VIQLPIRSPNAVSFSSARTTKRFPSQCASTIQIVRPSESTAENPAPTPTGFAEIVSDDFPNTSCAADSRLLFLAEFLESGIAAQRIPERIEP